MLPEFSVDEVGDGLYVEGDFCFGIVNEVAVSEVDEAHDCEYEGSVKSDAVEAR